MPNEDIKSAVDKTVEVLSTLPLTEIMKIYGFAMGVQANQPAA